MNLREMLEKMKPKGMDVFSKQIFLDALNFIDRPFERSAPMHFTSSGWVVNPEKTKILCVFHKIYQAYAPPGGHNDGNENSLEVAKKEVMEETGLQRLNVLGELPLGIQVAPVISHVRRGVRIAPHIHLDATFLFEADEQSALTVAEDENSEVCWLTFDELLEKTTEFHMIPIYEKLIAAVKQFSI